ncbi:hypothetical protein I3J27_23765 [Bradyrhizobium xenonodulans]|uniref:Antirepressor protein C-terminal domain-containing protein n=1 Tax=Bradyrhizobium xenonodulans TaxID=2736875 RepID=A0ABY7MCF1_9BRAD|nr:hypothetical protein [Bradyrhizobium xenonodulans]WBL76040.1 hypothetical protein I3J27_23765 [Bradyrhizobium xenonodulans]
MPVDELILKLIEALKWPGVALAALLMFRSTVTSLVSRAKSAAFGDKSVEFAEPTALAIEQKKQTIAVVEEQPPSQEAPPPPAPEAIVPFETNLKATLAQSHASDEVKIAWLVRGLAIEQIRRIHETNYRIILGSQIALLLKLNTGATIRLSDARELYEQTKKNHPGLYENFMFSEWVMWPKNVGLINFPDIAETSPVTITPAGKDFLHYLVETGLTGEKPG